VTTDSKQVLPVGEPGAGSTGSSVVAVDLDRTLIYSQAALALDPFCFPALMCVEVLNAVPASFMTERAGRLLELLMRESVLVPTTTRTRAQYGRVQLPGPPAQYAITANGGHLLVDGVLDAAWGKRVARALGAALALPAVHSHLTAVLRLDFTDSLRVADELFCYAMVRRAALPAGLVDELAGWAKPRGWVVSLQGRKLYCVPATVTKTAAVAEVARRVGVPAILAAGDSRLDAELLAFADAAIRPSHGELAETDWSHCTVAVTAATGVRAGEQMCAWLLDQVRQRRASGYQTEIRR